jgi:plastocyanin
MFNLNHDGPGRVGYAREKIHGAFPAVIPPSRLHMGREGKTRLAFRRTARHRSGWTIGHASGSPGAVENIMHTKAFRVYARVIVLSAVMVGVLLQSGFAREAETNPQSSNQPPESSVVTIQIVMDAQDRCDKAYKPSIVTIKAGTTVAWVNEDYETHTLISSQGDDFCKQKELPPMARVIDVGQLPPHKEYRKTFSKPGQYLYMCHLPFHHMGGKIIVVP